MREKDKILIIGTGGTIAGSKNSQDDTDYASGTLDINVLISSLHNSNIIHDDYLSKTVDIIVYQFSNINSDDMTMKMMHDLLLYIMDYTNNNKIKGVIITHGTDTMEETGFFLSLFRSNYTVPIVLTGAMLPADSSLADGPSNLYNAIRLLCSGKLSNDVYLHFAGNTYNARSIKKNHTTELSPFITCDIEFYNSLHNYVDNLIVDLGLHNTFSNDIFSNSESYDIFDINHYRSIDDFPCVPIVYFNVDADPDIFDYYLSKGAKGFIIAGAGAGEYSIPFINKIKELASLGIPVIRTSKIKNGPINQNEVLNKNTINGECLTPEKAAILLRMLLVT